MVLVFLSVGVVDEVHNTKLSAHFGSKKMHALLSARVWWLQMTKAC